jgi:hypothetical protein
MNTSNKSELNDKNKSENTNEQKINFNSQEPLLDTADKFEIYSKLLNASSKLAEEARHVNTLIGEANTAIAIGHAHVPIVAKTII